MKILVVAMLGFLSVCLKSSGQDSTNLKRPAFKLRMPVDNNFVYTADIASTPYVLPDNSIQLYPGENLYVKVDQSDGKITGLHAIGLFVYGSWKTPSVTDSVSGDGTLDLP